MTAEANEQAQGLRATGTWPPMATAHLADARPQEVNLVQVLEQLRLSFNGLLQRQEALERAVGALGALCACRAGPGQGPRS